MIINGAATREELTHISLQKMILKCTGSSFEKSIPFFSALLNIIRKQSYSSSLKVYDYYNLNFFIRRCRVLNLKVDSLDFFQSISRRTS